MTREEAIRILDPETTVEALEEIGYYGGFSGDLAKANALCDALTLAVTAIREQEERRWKDVTKMAVDNRAKLIKILRANKDLLHGADVSATQLLRLVDALLNSGVTVQDDNKPLTLDELREMDGEPVWCEKFGWRICYGVTDFRGCPCMETGGGSCIHLEDYGTTWVAYRHKLKMAEDKVVEIDQVKPLTNADRIRAMPDEELAVFLLQDADLCGQCNPLEFCTGYPTDRDRRCVLAVMKFLQQPAKGV